jgi:hypothetical protein
MKRIIILRHGEEPINKKINHISSKIGLNSQGAVRALLMPEIINKLVDNDEYELHTYTHTFNDKPTSRSFFTTLLLQNKILYDKSSDIDQLVNNIKASKSNTIIICWEHLQIPIIIHKLIGISPDYNKISKTIYNNLSKNIKMIEEQKITYGDINNVSVCSHDYLEQNMRYCGNNIKKKRNVKYSLVWDLNLNNNSYNVYPSYIIKKCDGYFIVSKYI